jgi:hypothetical protein
LQASFARTDGFCGAGILWENFAHQERLVAPAMDGFGHEFLRGAGAVHFGGVD